LNYLSNTDPRYFENGFIVFNSTGGTSNGKILLGLQNVELSYQNNTTDLATFDLNFNILKVRTTSEWSCTASGYYLTVSGESYSIHSGNTHVNGGTGTKELFAAAKSTSTNAHVWLKLADNHYEHGNVIIESISVSAGNPGDPMEFSISFQGSGPLTTSIT